jgi:hypothetical protein
VMSGGGAGEVQRGTAPAAAAPMSRWGPSRGWGVAQGLLSHRGDYHPDKSPRRTTKRRVGDGYDEQDVEGEDGSRGDDMALIWGGGEHTVFWRLFVSFPSDSCCRDPIPCSL